MQYPVKLLVGNTVTTQEAILEDELPASTLAEIERQWGQHRHAGNRTLELAGQASLCQHGHWVWDNGWKRGRIEHGQYRLMGVRVGAEWQGVMVIDGEPQDGYPWTFGGRILQFVWPARGLGSWPSSTSRPPRGISSRSFGPTRPGFVASVAS